MPDEGAPAVTPEADRPAQPDAGTASAEAPSPPSVAVPPGRHPALTGIFVILLFFTLHFARTFFLPVTLAVLLSFLLRPLVRGLRKLRFPAWLASIVVMLSVLGTVGFASYGLAGPAANWLEKAPRELHRLERKIRELREPVSDVGKAAKEVERLARGDSAPPRKVQIEGTGLASNLLSGTQALVAGVLVVVILLFFLLASGDTFRDKARRLLPDPAARERAIAIATQTEHHVSAYLFSVTVINACLGLAVGVAMALLGMPNPALWGVLAAVLNFVPYLGAMVTFAVLFMVSFLSFESTSRALLAPLVFLVLTSLEGQVITPYLVGRRLMLNPVVVFVGLIFWGWLWGVPGALMAVPLMATVKIVCDHMPRLRWVGELLGR
ncbi:MAG: AI-2E family transporter [Deltaproteobacteria bacterium]|nr:AI-2E family transporter [Deltaproteobacteria bacterium]MCB9788417.1 AI-2E family transporter [Deltaproteobacteria bacterium]